ncbi:hypothetical protein C819_01564 [Lachnospiraceae bacterium 10-1]|jgi:hypothetical protein|nr:hypothetical protein C819_01564 [Lachnospiraceae bacterium 10-1]
MVFGNVIWQAARRYALGSAVRQFEKGEGK